MSTVTILALNNDEPTARKKSAARYRRDPHLLTLQSDLRFNLEGIVRDLGFHGVEYQPVSDGLMSGMSKPIAIGKRLVLTTTNSKLLEADLAYGNWSKLYTVGFQFRRETDNVTHHTAFEQFTFGQKGADYVMMMDATESVLKNLIAKVEERHGDMIASSAKSWANSEWTRIPYTLASKKWLGQEAGNCETSRVALNQQLDVIVSHLSAPTFITEYPKLLGSPAGPLLDRPDVKQRAELFFPNSLEVANIWTCGTLLTQEEVTLMREIESETGIGPSMPYLETLELGIGLSVIGLERFAMVLTGSSHIDSVTQ